MRLIAGALALILVTAPLGAQTVRLRDVVARLDGYLQDYEERLSNVVAEEAYRQWVEQGPKEKRSRTSRILRSDFALTLTPERNGWVGYRDTFAVDGVAVRDREERLEQLLSSGAVGQAARIADENARFNLGEKLVSRNVNVPTFALEIMHPRFRDRVRVRRQGTDALDGREGWLVEFREQNDLTYVRTPEGGNQPTRVVALIDPHNGEVLRTVLTWKHLTGSITVVYGQVRGIQVAVPILMEERYVARSGELVGGEATYTNFRQFQTSGRIVQ